MISSASARRRTVVDRATLCGGCCSPSGRVSCQIAAFSRRVLACGHPAGLLPSPPCDGREDVIVRAEAASSDLGAAHRAARSRPRRCDRTGSGRGPDRRQARTGAGSAGAAAAARCGGAAGEQPLRGCEPEAAARRARTADQPAGPGRRSREPHTCATLACEAARRDLHDPGAAVVARRHPRSSQPRRPHLADRDRQLDLEAGCVSHPPGGLVPAPGSASPDSAAARACPAAPAGRGARGGP